MVDVLLQNSQIL